jgi:hypothetical protein
MRLRTIAFALLAGLVAAGAYAAEPAPAPLPASAPEVQAPDVCAPPPRIASPRPTLAAIVRIPGPCSVSCPNGVSCSATRLCLEDGTGIICDGRAFSCR